MLTGTNAANTSSMGRRWEASVTVTTVAPKPAVDSTTMPRKTTSAKMTVVELM